MSSELITVFEVAVVIWLGILVVLTFRKPKPKQDKKEDVLFYPPSKR